MQLTMQSGGSGVPAGAYQGEFSGVEPFENEHGPGIKWSWKITTGPFAGKIASRITGNRPSPKNSCGRLLNAMAGKTLSDGDQVDLSQFLGKAFTVIVQAGESGGTRVETVAPIAS